MSFPDFPSYVFSLVPITILWSSVLLDLTFGEPKNKYHPVRWIGNFIDYLQKAFRRFGNGIMSGTIFAITVIFTVIAVSIVILKLASLDIIFYIVVSLVMLKFTYAMRSMIDHINTVQKELVAGNLEGARLKLSYVVRRNPDELDEAHIISACIETIAEGLVDGFSTPVLLYGIFGIPVSYAARTINTLDSMVGYKDERNLKFGKTSAILDTIFNFIPARISAFIILAVAVGSDGKKEKLRHMVVESAKTESRNGGWPMGAMALALDVKLEKIGHYVLNEEHRLPSIDDLKKAIHVFRLAAYVILIIASIESLIVFTYL